MRLTKPQMELLREIARKPELVNGHYPPGAKLVELGYATRGDRRYGTMMLTITDVGRLALKETSDAQ